MWGGEEIMVNRGWQAQPLSGDLMFYLEGSNAEDRVRTYFSESEPLYTGRRFELLGGGGDTTDDADEFTAEDIVAVSLLSVDIPGSAALKILESGDQLNNLLALVPKGTTLWEVDPAKVDDMKSDAANLWNELRKIRGVGWVTANKLIARKRPHLIPVYDRVVKAALQPDSTMFWLPLRNSLLANDGHALERIQEIKSKVGLDRRYSLLRVMDAAVWMTSQVKTRSRK
jgi:hypothetical protein